MAGHSRRISEDATANSQPAAPARPGSGSAASISSLLSGSSPTSDLPQPAFKGPSTDNLPTPAPRPLATRPAKVNTGEKRPTGPPVNKMAMAAVVSPMPGASPLPKMPVSMTSKEWVVPPRPKPGRKPATDTPPTKRKAQNRAAQRAFRERRAARIGELEEQLEEQKEDHEKEEHVFAAKITALEKDANTLRGRCQVLESLLENERREREQIHIELENYRRRWDDEAHSRSGRPQALPGGQSLSRTPLPSGYSGYQPSTSARQTPGTRAPAQSLPISQIISPPETNPFSCGSCGPNGACACAEEVLETGVIGCGKCTLGGRCECLEAEVSAISAPPGSELKRPLLSPVPGAQSPHQKRQRSDATDADFAAGSGGHKRSPSIPVSVQHIPPAPHAPQPLHSLPDKDGCGFCKDGTYCACADAAMALVSTSTAPTMAGADGSQHHQMTPPPSESDVGPIPVEVMANGAVKLPSASQRRHTTPATPAAVTQTGTCSAPNGPGTCAQCLADPKSGLFCRSLAANFARTHGDSSASPAGCCGNAGPGGCCKGGSATAGNANLTLSCAETYKTLASHRHFDEAADDIGTWLPLLKAAPPPVPGNRFGIGDTTEGDRAAERPPIEVEAASIMGVLKSFDVRFGK